MIGNPTNPTGVLHPAVAVRSLLGPGRVVVVDEAFMDAVPGESGVADRRRHDRLARGSLADQDLGARRPARRLRRRRPDVLAGLRAQQPPWSVSTPALAAMTACLSPEAREMAAEAALEIANNERSSLISWPGWASRSTAHRPRRSS